MSTICQLVCIFLKFFYTRKHRYPCYKLKGYSVRTIKKSLKNCEKIVAIHHKSDAAMPLGSKSLAILCCQTHFHALISRVLFVECWCSYVLRIDVRGLLQSALGVWWWSSLNSLQKSSADSFAHHRLALSKVAVRATVTLPCYRVSLSLFHQCLRH